jgi:hypothetical protein
VVLTYDAVPTVDRESGGTVAPQTTLSWVVSCHTQRSRTTHSPIHCQMKRQRPDDDEAEGTTEGRAIDTVMPDPVAAAPADADADAESDFDGVDDTDNLDFIEVGYHRTCIAKAVDAVVSHVDVTIASHVRGIAAGPDVAWFGLRGAGDTLHVASLRLTLNNFKTPHPTKVTSLEEHTRVVYDAIMRKKDLLLTVQDMAIHPLDSLTATMAANPDNQSALKLDALEAWLERNRNVTTVREAIANAATTSVPYRLLESDEEGNVTVTATLTLNVFVLARSPLPESVEAMRKEWKEYLLRQQAKNVLAEIRDNFKDEKELLVDLRTPGLWTQSLPSDFRAVAVTAKVRVGGSHSIDEDSHMIKGTAKINLSSIRSIKLLEPVDPELLRIGLNEEVCRVAKASGLPERVMDLVFCDLRRSYKPGDLVSGYGKAAVTFVAVIPADLEARRARIADRKASEEDQRVASRVEHVASALWTRLRDPVIFLTQNEFDSLRRTHNLGLFPAGTAWYEVSLADGTETRVTAVRDLPSGAATVLPTLPLDWATTLYITAKLNLGETGHEDRLFAAVFPDLATAFAGPAPLAILSIPTRGSGPDTCESRPWYLDAKYRFKGWHRYARLVYVDGKATFPVSYPVKWDTAEQLKAYTSTPFGAAHLAAVEALGKKKDAAFNVAVFPKFDREAWAPRA